MAFMQNQRFNPMTMNLNRHPNDPCSTGILHSGLFGPSKRGLQKSCFAGFLINVAVAFRTPEKTHQYEMNYA